MAEVLGVDDKLGTIEIGKLADMVIVDANPMANLKVLFGTGAILVNEDNEVTRHGGVVYTIKDGIVFDAKALLKDVADMVKVAKENEGTDITQPGLDYCRLSAPLKIQYYIVWLILFKKSYKVSLLKL